MNNLPQTFFREWLPQHFRKIVEAEPRLVDIELIVGAQVDNSTFLLRASKGELAVEEGEPLDGALFVLKTTLPTYQALLAPVLNDTPDLSRAPLAKLVALDAQAQDLLKGLPGGIELQVNGPEHYSLALVPGRADANQVVCTVRCGFDALEELKSGKAQPLELLMAGRLELDGDIQVAMALASLAMTP